MPLKLSESHWQKGVSSTPHHGTESNSQVMSIDCTPIAFDHFWWYNYLEDVKIIVRQLCLWQEMIRYKLLSYFNSREFLFIELVPLSQTSKGRQIIPSSLSISFSLKCIHN